jgi:hypothetical protein
MASNAQLSADSLGMYSESYWLPAAGKIAKYFHFGVRNVQEQFFRAGNPKFVPRQNFIYHSTDMVGSRFHRSKVKIT